MPAETAKVVLSRRTLRWSSPILFNDPFDVPREMSFGVESAEIFKALSKRVASLIDRPPENMSALTPELKLIADVVKRGIPRELKDKMLAGIQALAAAHVPNDGPLDELRQLWRSWLPDFRILCFTASPAHVAMWYHYAKQYTGAVLEFRCVDELDSAWLAAKPVTYPSAKPLPYTAEGWADLLMLNHGIAVRTILDSATYTKSPDWSYEAEWRIASSKRPRDTGHFSDYPYHPYELGAVYLGPLMSATDREEVVTLARDFPDARVWNVQVGMNRELVFSAE